MPASVTAAAFRFALSVPDPGNVLTHGQEWSVPPLPAGHYQIPVLAYGSLVITSTSGLHEEYMVSNAPAVEQFGVRWAEYKKS
jgi:hypothetical protein